MLEACVSLELERALSKLKFDESVRGYALVTNDGIPFLTFSIPEEVFPQIAGTLRIHSSSLRMMNVLTNEGIVVLARVDPNWVLAVLFNEQQLGMALQRTKEVVSLLENTTLPPPPSNVISVPIASVPDSSLPLVEEVPVTDTAHPKGSVESTSTGASTTTDLLHEIPPEQIEVQHGCVVMRGVRFCEALSISSDLAKSLRAQYSNLAMDILLMVDNRRTVFKISQDISKNVEDVINVVRECVSKRILELECPQVQVSKGKEITDFPVFSGDLSKVPPAHRSILELCDGSLTLQEIAKRLGLQYFQVLQCTLQYKGKTLKFVRREKIE